MPSLSIAIDSPSQSHSHVHKPESQQAPLQLPTPSSLPLNRHLDHLLNHGQTATDSSTSSGILSEDDDEKMNSSGNESVRAADPVGWELPTFSFDSDDDAPRSEAVSNSHRPAQGSSSEDTEYNNAPDGGSDSGSPLSPMRSATGFSSTVRIRRPYRARYEVPSRLDTDGDAIMRDATTSLPPASAASGGLGSGAISFGTSATTTSTATPSGNLSPFKRTFEQVTPSSGTTPPATDVPTLSTPISVSTAPSFSPFTRTTLTSPRPDSSSPGSNEWRHSFESQRASSLRFSRYLIDRPEEGVGSTSSSDAAGQPSTHHYHHRNSLATTGGTLRRRSPLPTRDLNGGNATPSAATSHQTTPSHSSPQPQLDRLKRRRAGTLSPSPEPQTSPQFQLDPSLSSFPTPPTITSSSTRRSRLSLPSLSLSRSPPTTTATTSAVSIQGTSSALPTPTPPLRPRSARSRGDPMRERERDPLVAFWREERDFSASSSSRETTDVVRDTLQESERILDRADESIWRVERERGVGFLFDPFGEEATGMVAPQPPASSMGTVGSPPARSRQVTSDSMESVPSRPTLAIPVTTTTTITSSPTSFSMSPPSSPDLGGPSASRTAMNLLGHLRARRPRLSRNSISGTRAPEVDSAISPPGMGEWDEAFELSEARRLTARLEASRAVAVGGVEAAGSVNNRELWGDVIGSRSTVEAGRRLRGPTERANEIWRMGRAPPQEQSSSSSQRQQERTTGIADWRANILADPSPGGEVDNAWVEPWSEILPGSALLNTDSRWTTSRRDWSSVPRPSTATNVDQSTARTLPPLHRTPSASGDLSFSLFGRIPPAPDRDDDLHVRRAALREARLATDNEYRDRQRASFSATLGGSGTRRAMISNRPQVGLRASPGIGLDDDEEAGSETGGLERAPWRNFRDLREERAQIIFPHPAEAAGPSLAGTLRMPGIDDEDRPRSNLADHLARTSPPRRSELLSTRSPSVGPTNRPLAPRVERTLSEGRRSTLADALAHLGARAEALGGDSNLRRRSAAPSGMPTGRTMDEDRDRIRQSRSERLASLRMERVVMQSLLGRNTPPEVDAGETRAGERLTGRRRNLGEFLRGIGGGASAHRFGALLDDDFSSFFGRDSAALDPRNYLDDDDFDTSYESLLRLSERLGDVKPKGVSPSKLSQLQQFPYRDWPMPARKRSSTPPLGVATTSACTIDDDLPPLARRGLEKEERCAVCLIDYEDEDECMLGHCGHGFHSDCLSAWLKDHAACPVCRRDFSA